jgi:hypothetical protein
MRENPPENAILWAYRVSVNPKSWGFHSAGLAGSNSGAKKFCFFA